MKPLILLLVAAVITSPLPAQDSSRTSADAAIPELTPLYRDPQRAVIFGSVIPGAGHIYAGEYLRGYGTYLVTIGTIGMGAIALSLEGCTFTLFNKCKPGPDWPSRIVGAAAVGAGIWIWISSARDAGRAAVRANIKHSRKVVRPTVNTPIGPRRDWRVGVQIAY